MDDHRLLRNVQALVNKLFEAEQKRINKVIDKLSEENASLGNSRDGFFHRGIFWSSLPQSMRKQATKGALSSSLVSKAELLYKDQNKLSYDRTRIHQGLAIILKGCNSHQDIRDAIPNSLSSLLPELAKIERTREEAYNLDKDSRQYKQYMETKPLIEFYVSMRLLY